jgi:dihydropteroate synthase
MQDLAHYADVVDDVRRELVERVEAANQAGISADRIVIDPGLGFAKTAAHNWALLAHLDGLVGLGLPVLIGASRKSFLGRVLADPAGTPRPVDEREAATVALTAYAAAQGAWGVRVHDVRANVDAARTIAAVREAATDD